MFWFILLGLGALGAAGIGIAAILDELEHKKLAVLGERAAGKDRSHSVSYNRYSTR